MLVGNNLKYIAVTVFNTLVSSSLCGFYYFLIKMEACKKLYFNNKVMSN